MIIPDMGSYFKIKEEPGMAHAKNLHGLLSRAIIGSDAHVTCAVLNQPMCSGEVVVGCQQCSCLAYPSRLALLACIWMGTQDYFDLFFTFLWGITV